MTQVPASLRAFLERGRTSKGENYAYRDNDYAKCRRCIQASRGFVHRLCGSDDRAGRSGCCGAPGHRRRRGHGGGVDNNLRRTGPSRLRLCGGGRGDSSLAPADRVVYIAGGIYLAANPGLSLQALTLVLAGIFFAEGVMRMVFFFQTRPLPGSGWILSDGVLTVLLGFLIVRDWPASSSWAIGTIVGVNLCVSGITRLMFSVMARRALTAEA